MGYFNLGPLVEGLVYAVGLLAPETVERQYTQHPRVCTTSEYVTSNIAALQWKEVHLLSCHSGCVCSLQLGLGQPSSCTGVA